MSRSATIRPIELTEAEYAAMVERVRTRRLNHDVVGALRDQVRTGAQRLRGSSSLDPRVTHLEKAAAGATSVEQLRAIHLELSTLSLGRSRAGTVLRGRESSPMQGRGLMAVSSLPGRVVFPVEASDRRRDQPMVDGEVEDATRRAGFAFDVAVVAAELRSITTTATDLGVKIDDPEDLAGRLEELVAQGNAGAIEVLEGRLDEIRAEVEALDERVNAALAAAEARSRAVSAALGAIEGLGYRISRVDVGADATVVVADAEDGRHAQLAVHDRPDGTVDVDLETTDPGSMVEAGDPAAASVCEQAVLDAYAIHEALGRVDGTTAGRPEALGRPVRGATGRRSRRSGRGGQRRRQR